MFIKQITKDSLVIGAPAKINLFLKVLNKRPDGYHNIDSLFQAVSLFDRIKFTRNEQNNINIKLKNDIDLTTGDDNLINRTFNHLKNKFSFEGGLDVELEKNIPIAGGLGGGSTDAAATIMACNMLFSLNLKYPEMAEIGLRLGSDIPFFFSSGQARVTGRGEIIKEISLPTDYWLMLVNPGQKVSTATSYSSLKLNLTNSEKTVSFINCRTTGDLIKSLNKLSNDFEGNHLKSFPAHDRIKGGLLRLGAGIARMSGTGATFFGIFVRYPTGSYENIFNGGNWQVNLVRPITLQKRDKS